MQSYQRTRKSARSNTQRSSVPYVSELAQFSRAGDRVCMLVDRVAPETDCARVAFAADTRGYFRRFPVWRSCRARASTRVPLPAFAMGAGSFLRSLVLEAANAEDEQHGGGGQKDTDFREDVTEAAVVPDEILEGAHGPGDG